MHTTLQSGSPKLVNGPTSTSPVKTSSDNLQKGAPSFPSRNKRKKREHRDHGMESVKRERSSKIDNGDSNQLKADNVLKSEIANITEKGGLVDSEGVEKLVKLMQPDRVERKIDLISRSMLVGAVAETDKVDCLTQFLQLRGLLVLDEWLQDIHKGKIDAGNYGDRAVEEFLLVLLRALDKLPVNLQSLQMCNIGRSVNHLRTNKNLEIQKKARSLVDTWKKRVKAEMNIIETKSRASQAVSSPSKSRVPEVSHSGSRHGGRSYEISRKSSGALLPASKSSSPKPILGETATKSVSSSPGSLKTASSSGTGKDGRSRISVAADLPSVPVKEEKSSSSSQSHTQSHSMSGKEDARSSTAGSMSVDKMSGGTSRHRKSVSDGLGPSASGVQRETRSSKTTLLHSTSTSERLSGLTCEKAVDVPTVEGKNQKLIVKIPNQGRSPSLSTSGGLSEDPTIMNSRASSPLPSEKHDQFDCNIKEKNDARRVNVTSDVITESWQSNDFKDVLTGSDEGDVSPVAVHDEDQSKYADDVKKPAEVSKVASSSPWNESTSENKYSGSIPFTAVRTSLSARDDVGMNLLASVAAGEMPKSNFSPTDSSGNLAVLENHDVGGESKIRLSPGDIHQNESGGGTENGEKLGVIDGSSRINDELRLSTHSMDDLSGGRKVLFSSFKVVPSVYHEHSNSFSMDLQPTADHIDTSERAKMKDSVSVAVSSICNENVMTAEVSKHQEGKTAITILEDIQEHKENGSLLADDVASHSYGSTKDMVLENHKGLEIKQDGELSNRSSTGKAGGERSAQGTNDPVVIEGSAGTAKPSERVDVEFESKKAQEQQSDESVFHNELPALRCQDVEPHVRLEVFKAVGGAIEEGTEKHACRTANASLSNEGAQNVDAKMAFDLNEGSFTEEAKSGKSSNLPVPECTSSMRVVSPLPFPISSVPSYLPASVTVAAASKGPFISVQELLRSKGELRWKGSAATSAFRPAEPRKVLEMLLGSGSISLPGDTGSKNERPVLDFDLNVADERSLEDMASHDLAIETSSALGLKSYSDLPQNEIMGSVHAPSSARFELDLNSVVEANDMGQYPSTSGSSCLKDPFLQVKLASSRGGFDLNDGPVLDDDTSEPLFCNQLTRTGLQPQALVGSIRMNSTEIGNFSSWSPSGNTYSTVTGPVFHGTGNKPFPIISPQKTPGPSAVDSLATDLYRGSVSSAVPYAATSFQYPIFPFGASFPAAPATFSGVPTPFMDSSSGGRLGLPGANSNMLGPAVAASSHAHRAYMVGLTDGSGNGGMESNRKWSMQGLDLNAGPSGGGVEGREETLLLASRQFSVASSQPLVEEQARMHCLSGGNYKRKEPDGSWDTESSRHKQFPWQ